MPGRGCDGPWIALAASVALVLPVLFAWALFAPTPVGGSVFYVIIVGSSMQPHLHRGDLVIVQQAEDYQVGDIVADHNPDIGRVVLHRIVGRDGDRYVFKGDNNTWLDSYHPRRTDLVGKRWFQVPTGGAVMERLRSPRNAALSIGLLTALTGAAASGATNSNSKRPRRERHRRWLHGSVPRPAGTAMLALFGICAFALLPVAVTAFHRPTTRVAWSETAYRQGGTFNYHAEAPPSPVYNEGLVQNGDPIFLQLVPAVTVDFAYEFSSDAAHAVAGTGQLTAQLSDVNGWKRTLELQPRASFAGDRFTGTGTIDLVQVKELADSVQALTGIARDRYTLTVSADVQVSGTIGGQELQDTLTQPLVFSFDPLQLQLQRSSGIAGAEPADPLSASKVSTVRQPHSDNNTLSALGLRLGVHGPADVRNRGFGMPGWSAGYWSLDAPTAQQRRTVQHPGALRSSADPCPRRRYAGWGRRGGGGFHGEARADRRVLRPDHPS